MIYRAALVMLLTASTLLSSRPTFAATRFDPRPVPPMRRVLTELNLSPAQRRQLLQLRRTRQNQMVRIMPQLRARRRELAELYRAHPLDEAKANKLIDEIAALEALRLRSQLQDQLDLRRILTPEQFARFTRLMDSRPGPPPQPTRSTGP
jgi:Spy/CpxP family protein refolding chaperone